jgi:hypothetical protein
MNKLPNTALEQLELPLCNLEVPNSAVGPKADLTDGGYCRFPQHLHENAEMMA